MSVRPASARASHLMAWGRGAATVTSPENPRGRTIVLDSARHAADLLATDLVHSATVLFLPATGAVLSAAEGPAVLGYEGSFSDTGDDICVDGDFYLQTQTYAVSEFMSVVGPTLVRITGDDDFAAFLADADRAWESGEFAGYLTHPAVHLADLPGLGHGASGDGPALRLYVFADGAVSTSPTGLPFGELGDSLATLEREWLRLSADCAVPCGVCLGAALPDDRRSAALADRRWAARYLTALDALRDACARGLEAPRVSGFGGRLVAGLGDRGLDADVADGTAPVLLWTDQAAQLYVPTQSRSFALGADAAALVEILLAAGHVEPAVECAQDLLRLDGATARDALGLLVRDLRRLGVPMPTGEAAVGSLA